MELRQAALDALCLQDPDAKCGAVRAIWDAFADVDGHRLDTESAKIAINLIAIFAPDATHTIPGRPAQPELQQPLKVAQRGVGRIDGRAALIHAICHIEFNAINLALDAIWRFADMPVDFYLDWLRVAHEEAQHFQMLRDHLRSLRGPNNETWDYGSFAAHDGLWQMCEKTAGDITARMALVPRTLEARGLDATPLIQQRLRQIGTPDALAAVAILDVILRDEIGHVAIGNRWYRWLCQRDGLDPIALYPQLVERYRAPKLKAPFNADARRLAGFSDAELAYLAGDGVADADAGSAASADTGQPR